MIQANETVRKVKSETVSLKIIGVQDKGHVLFDSAFGNLKNRCSQQDYVKLSYENDSSSPKVQKLTKIKKSCQKYTCYRNFSIRANICIMQYDQIVYLIINKDVTKNISVL